MTASPNPSSNSDAPLVHTSRSNIRSPTSSGIDYVFKLLMLGEASVGKTSLTHRYIRGVFVDSPRLTIGVDFFSKKMKIPDQNISAKLQIWDFGGEKRFRFLLPTYSKGANACLFLYDITAADSLQSLPVWLEIVRKNAGNIPILLIGTKKDLKDHRVITTAEAFEEGKINSVADHIELSAKTGEGVELSFEKITELLVKQAKKLVEEQQNQD